MKPSGVEWIGSIPNNWEMKKIKYIATLKGRIGWQGLTTEEYTTEGAYLITGTDFKDGGINWDTCVHVPINRWEEAKDIQIENGDLLITKDGTIGKVAIVSGLEGPCSLNSGVMRISTIEGYDKRFLFWVLQSEVFWSWFANKNAGNSTIIHLYQGDFEEFNYAVPPLNEQKEIAAFLDKECETIDAVIRKLYEQIRILDLYKKSLITEIVSQGLNNDTDKKYSGFEWIGEIPETWDIKRLKYVCRFQTGTTPSNNEGISFEEDGYNWYTPSDFPANMVMADSERYITTDIVNRNNISIYNKGTVLIVGIGATVGKIGYTMKESYSNQQVTALIPTNIYGKYLMYYLYSKADYIKDNALYTTMPIINNAYLSNIIIPVPKETEQKEIVDYLDERCLVIEKIMKDKEYSIKKITKYKESLIYEYVTGKKRVLNKGV